MIYSPLEHFELNYFTYLYIYYYDLSITSTTFYFILMTLFLIMITSFLVNYSFIPKKSQYVLENFTSALLVLFKQQLPSLRLLKFFPFYFTIALTIFFLNFTSLVAYNISLTGHIMITLSYSFIIFLGLIIIGFLNYRLYFLTLFYPKGVPVFLLVFLIIIELLSFLIRPFSLAIRLFANMLAGHTLLGIFSAFANFILNKVSLILFLPLIFCFLILLLEFGVAIIQVYVFFILICIYLNDISDLSNH